MNAITFQVYGIAQPKGSSRAFKRGDRIVVTSDNPSLAKWEDAVRYAAQAVAARPGHQLFRDAVAIAVTFYLPRPKSISPKKRPLPVTRPDLSKLIRGLEDPLTGILWTDDAQVVDVQASKRYADGPAHATVVVREAARDGQILFTEG